MKKHEKSKKSFKHIKKITFFLLFGFMLQFALLFFLDQFVLGKRDIAGTMTFKEITNTKTNLKIPDPIDLPEYIDNIQLSHNTHYLSYIQNDELKVLDTVTNYQKNITMPMNGSITNCTWIPGSDRLYISFKTNKSNNAKFTFFVYDAKKDNLNQAKYKVSDSGDNREEDCKIVCNKNSKIKDIQVSNLTGMFLLKLQNSYSSNSLYTFNRMNSLSRLKISSNNIGTIALMLNTDTVLYEKLPQHDICCLFSNKTTKKLNVTGIKHPTLISTDKEGLIYVGSLINKKLDTIFYRTLDDTLWKKFKFPYSVNKKDIYIINKDKIYINNSSENTLTEIHTNNSIKYKGTLIGVYENRIASLNDSKLIIDKLK
ncbi:hypothetical protein G8V03_10845 [Clostridium botulinum D/C]|uniref:hypothetical protein n=1 Tax=Clostridium botulinum TaxID=1491 RepID=UPI001E3D71AA|nr:hypothetical protein [Clostridium botulinum]MCD3351480.1 hypothetical protein [Clostridium botulinum D/C]MCD3360436.1 hypothetical protein [Clostridium botulinum D/C]MCD3362649.1 hypothetical protein [Clostridium botulinum D/C]MCD3366211.1 hypothetical protein [Clostridium botulinum D/C]